MLSNLSFPVLISVAKNTDWDDKLINEINGKAEIRNLEGKNSISLKVASLLLC